MTEEEDFAGREGVGDALPTELLSSSSVSALLEVLAEGNKEGDADGGTFGDADEMT